MTRLYPIILITLWTAFACGGAPTQAVVAERPSAESEPEPLGQSAEENPDPADDAPRAAEQLAQRLAQREAREAARRAHFEEFSRIATPISPILVAEAREIYESRAPFDTFAVGEHNGYQFITLTTQADSTGGGVFESYVFRGQMRSNVGYVLNPGTVVGHVEVTPTSSRPSPRSHAEIRRTLEAVYGTTVITHRSDPRWGLAQLFLRAGRIPRVHPGEGFSAYGPLYPPGVRPAVFPLSEGESPEPRVSEGPTTPPALIQLPNTDRWMRIGGVLSECPRVEVGPYVLRECTLLGRYGGVAVALEVDGESRWIFETRDAILGRSVEWAGHANGWLFAHIQDEHPGWAYIRGGGGGVIAVRASDGATYRIEVPGVEEQCPRGCDWQQTGHRMCFGRELRRHGIDRRQLDAPGPQHDDALAAIDEACGRPRIDQVTLSEGMLRIRRGDGTVEVQHRDLFQALP